MNTLSLRTPWIYYLIITITLLITFLSFCLPSFIKNYGLFFVIILILGIGIPHGATDHLVFNYLSAPKNSPIFNIKFYSFYIFWLLVYSLCWYLFPSFSLGIFIIISTYHLGQSNFSYLSLPENKIIKPFIYSSSGLFVIFAPIISKFKETSAILENILGESWIINLENKEYFLLFIIILNFLIISALFIFNYANKKELLRETLNLTVLGLLFYTAPLMVSFGVYFGLWHSLGSTFDQIQFIKKYNLKFNFVDFYINSIPFSIISIVIFILGYLTSCHFNKQYYQENLNSVIGWFFIGIAIITLPHTILRDKLYSRGK